ncbi:hypothetical protein ABW19_dt0202786 [Dactylella cylindrospora]|nr:hypothetical protein ABW19_dt0202786 [Dactylella cylindrospora]
MPNDVEGEFDNIASANCEPCSYEYGKRPMYAYAAVRTNHNSDGTDYTTIIITPESSEDERTMFVQEDAVNVIELQDKAKLELRKKEAKLEELQKEIVAKYRTSIELEKEVVKLKSQIDLLGRIHGSIDTLRWGAI